MKRTPPPLATGYRLAVASVPGTREHGQKTRFTLQTSQLFASFVYDLSVEDQREGNHIHFKIMGLKPPQLSMPSAGRASFEREYDDLAGTCQVTVESFDGKTNTFKLRITGAKIAVLQSPRERFIELEL